MPDLKSMVGKEIAALVPLLHKTVFQRLKLHGVEQGGIWIESQKFTDEMLAGFGISSAPKTLIFFLPWTQVVTIWGSLDVPSLSETGFGV